MSPCGAFRGRVTPVMFTNASSVPITRLDVFLPSDQAPMDVDTDEGKEVRAACSEQSVGLRGGVGRAIASREP